MPRILCPLHAAARFSGNGSYTSPLTHSLCSNTASRRATATLARLRAFLSPRILVNVIQSSYDFRNTVAQFRNCWVRELPHHTSIIVVSLSGVEGGIVTYLAYRLGLIRPTSLRLRDAIKGNSDCKV